MDAFTKGSTLYALKNLTFNQLKEFMFISSDGLYLTHKNRLEFDVVDLADRIIIVNNNNPLKVFKHIKETLCLMDDVEFVLKYIDKCIENCAKKVSFNTPLISEHIILCPKTPKKRRPRFRYIKPIDCRLRRRLF
ncbi:IFN-inducible protein [Eptesipox virus]|uniref:IFN-inducible protein n=1 Tax=Eptesipox virus TaxID=1329402 RepID=A0A220T683_9POXV|nr:IFN-inducible protein [Eptesipox virus]ASK51219.1 IFN-inducible protein [Eptesipox virus]WAH70977.1 IFN-inducible protein [Eptesipox virus]